ncbi:MAG: prepilin-type N-terminal cleavage/methylation domain-containing protein [Burkholderiaceae bacterium]|nr:MAG: prepilin-type N-terminal cleavage/methylation domain-containing protein [Burkholderiaceae bacterium]
MLVSPAVPFACSWRRASARGFTLIELMTTITVLIVLVMVAVPSFREFVANQRVRNASFDLMAALTLARSQAITQNGSVDLKQSGGGWNGGWTVTDGTNTFGAHEGLSNLSITDSSNLSTITYGRDGRLTTVPTKFSVKPATDLGSVKPRCITIGLSGLPTSAEGACS